MLGRESKWSKANCPEAGTACLPFQEATRPGQCTHLPQKQTRNGSRRRSRGRMKRRRENERRREGGKERKGRRREGRRGEEESKRSPKPTLRTIIPWGWGVRTADHLNSSLSVTSETYTKEWERGKGTFWLCCVFQPVTSSLDMKCPEPCIFPWGSPPCGCWGRNCVSWCTSPCPPAGLQVGRPQEDRILSPAFCVPSCLVVHRIAGIVFRAGTDVTVWVSSRPGCYQRIQWH